MEISRTILLKKMIDKKCNNLTIELKKMKEQMKLKYPKNQEYYIFIELLNKYSSIMMEYVNYYDLYDNTRLDSVLEEENLKECFQVICDIEDLLNIDDNCLFFQENLELYSFIKIYLSEAYYGELNKIYSPKEQECIRDLIGLSYEIFARKNLDRDYLYDDLSVYQKLDNLILTNPFYDEEHKNFIIHIFNSIKINSIFNKKLVLK